MSGVTSLHTDDQIHLSLGSLAVLHATSYSYQLHTGHSLATSFPDLARSVWHPDNMEALRPVYQGWFVRQVSNIFIVQKYFFNNV